VVGVSELNLLGLHNASLAVLSTLFFNAIIIPLMVPVALRGAPFRPRTAVELLRNNILVYGFGGFLSAFVGIWLCYAGLQLAVSSPFIAPVLQAIVHLLGS
jgi:K+-transporting ATPase ATPase B chain